MEAAESLFECLEQVPDPRMARGVRHPFQAILRDAGPGGPHRPFARMNSGPLGFLRDHPPHSTTISRCGGLA